MIDRRRKTDRAAVAARRGAKREGFALVLVLFLVVLMSVTVAALTVRASGGYRLAQSRAIGWKLYYASRAAIEEAKAKMWRDAMTPKKVPGILAPPEPMKLDEDGVSVTIEFEDEAGKIAVNNLVSADDAKKQEMINTLARLFADLDLPSSTGLATSARDFISEEKDASKRTSGKHAALFDISELAGAKGFSMDTLFRPRSPNLPPAADCLTTWYTGNVNVNSASPIVLKALEPSLTDDDIKRIIAAREKEPFAGPEDLARSGAAAPAIVELVKKVTFTTDLLTFKVEARQGNFFRRIAAVVWFESSAAHTSYIRDGWQAHGGWQM
jgi:type II secretory pathway component PulK